MQGQKEVYWTQNDAPVIDIKDSKSKCGLFFVRLSFCVPESQVFLPQSCLQGIAGINDGLLWFLWVGA
jgi:hypothetical protein